MLRARNRALRHPFGGDNPTTHRGNKHARPSLKVTVRWHSPSLALPPFRPSWLRGSYLLLQSADVQTADRRM